MVNFQELKISKNSVLTCPYYNTHSENLVSSHHKMFREVNWSEMTKSTWRCNIATLFPRNQVPAVSSERRFAANYHCRRPSAWHWQRRDSANLDSQVATKERSVVYSILIRMNKRAINAIKTNIDKLGNYKKFLWHADQIEKRPLRWHSAWLAANGFSWGEKEIKCKNAWPTPQI